MAIISTYTNDTTVSGEDRLIGTDSVTGQVRNFPISDVVALAGSSDTIDNQNAADADEPATFKLWSGNRAEYDALTPEADTMYNITDDVMFVDTVVNQNSSSGFKFWSGTLVEYTALTPSSDTLYNITDD